MKTSEFKVEVEKMGFVVEEGTHVVTGELFDTPYHTLIVKTRTGVIMGVVTVDMPYWFKLGHEAFFLPLEKRRQLLLYLNVYASTPILQRQEEEYFDISKIEDLATNEPITVQRCEGGWKIIEKEDKPDENE